MRLILLAKRGVTFVTPLILILAVVLFQLLDVAVLKISRERLDGLFYDYKVSHLAPWPQSVTNIQIVDIDESSLAKVGRMPWSRDIYAQLTQNLTDLGAIVITYDLLFSEPQNNPLLPLLAQFSLNIPKDELKALVKQFDYDQQFVNSVAQTEAVFPVLLHQSQDSETHQALQTGELDFSRVAQSQAATVVNIPNYKAFAGLIPPLANVASGQGFMNSFEDADGFVRRVALLAQVDNTLYPSLALETFRVYSLLEQIYPVWQVFEGHAYLQGLQVGNTWIATDNQAKIFVPFRGKPKTFPYTSAAEVLQGKIQDQRFEQAVVFVGTSATGLADLRATPVSLGFPGVEIHATIFDSLLTPQFIPYQPEWWAEAVLIQLLVIGLFCLMCFPKRSPLSTLLFALFLLSLVLLGNLLLWFHFFIYLPLFSPLILTVLLSLLYVARGFFAENKQRRQVKAMFDQYVPPAHIDRMLQEPYSLTLAGERKELSVLFSDIRDFTSISESMSAEELKLWLNQFFSPITHAILEADGTIDKYVGDMVMAFWGAPLEESQHANKAIKGAFNMLQKLTELNAFFITHNQIQATIGIGINTGEMNVGDMGSDFRRSYTVIGDAVNLGSRLESLTKYYQIDILVSEFTRQQATDYAYLFVDKVKVKGKQKPIRIYSPLPHELADKQVKLVEQFNAIVALFYAQQFARVLDKLNAFDGSFTYLSIVDIYKQRAYDFLLNPPSENWDGSFVHSHK